MHCKLLVNNRHYIYTKVFVNILSDPFDFKYAFLFFWVDKQGVCGIKLLVFQK